MSKQIIHLLTPETVSLNLQASSSDEVIIHLGNLLYQAGYVKETFTNAAIERETKLPTGLPLNGKLNAAIPHTEVDHVIKPALALATLQEPVIFQNMVNPAEAIPVRLIFVLALDKPKAQIEALQEIAAVLQNKQVVQDLIGSLDFQDVQAAISSI